MPRLSTALASLNAAPVALQVLDARAHLSRRQTTNVTAIPTSSSALAMIISVITPSCTPECNFFISDLAVSICLARLDPESPS
jgi:nitrate/nitrite transporter NarK